MYIKGPCFFLEQETLLLVGSRNGFEHDFAIKLNPPSNIVKSEHAYRIAVLYV